MSASPAFTQTVAGLGADIDEATNRLPLPAHLVDSRGFVRWQSARSIELFGDLSGRPLMEIVAPEAQPSAWIELTKKVLGTVRTSDYETILRLPSGERLRVEMHCAAFEGGGRVVGIFAIVNPDGAGQPEAPPLREDLTPRQLEILRALARGTSTAQIAESLHLSRETVRNHVRGILRAFRVHSRLAAVAEARRRNVIE
jgi:DNA-binding CsgD family transcriptional regulator